MKSYSVGVWAALILALISLVEVIEYVFIK